MADLGEVIKENLSKSFSTSAYKKALDCLQVMREQAMIVSDSLSGRRPLLIFDRPLSTR